MAQQIQFRRGTAAEWTTYNPILAQGEMGIELDTKQYKIGDGALTWSALPYGGITGAGVPVGGLVGQLVVKTGTGNYVTGWATINKTTLGLGDVDNTSDADKPISTATQDALDSITTDIADKQPLDSDLTAIGALSSTGMVTRTGAGAYATRSIGAGAGISVTNADGITADPTVALTNTGVTAQTYGSAGQVPVINVDAQGRITEATTAPVMITLTANKAVITDGSGTLTTGAVTATEVGYLAGITGPIQTQIDGKYNQPTGTTADYIRGDGSLALFPTLAQADRLVTTVRNQTGSLIPAGSVVYINGSSGNNPTITLALADSDINSAKTYGLTSAAIADNATGLVVAMGRLQNINTSAFVAGASIYLSPTVPGGYTTTKPSAPNHLVALGFIIRSHPTQGEIEVKIINGFELGELHDVAISATPVTGQSIYYDSVTELWSNQTPPMSITGQMAVSLETAVSALTDAAIIAINATLGNTFTVTLGGDRTLGTPTNPSSGQKIIVRVTQDGTGGRTITYSAGWNLGSDFAGLSLSTTPGATDYIGAIYNAITSKWDIVSIMRGY